MLEVSTLKQQPPNPSPVLQGSAELLTSSECWLNLSYFSKLPLLQPRSNTSIRLKEKAGSTSPFVLDLCNVIFLQTSVKIDEEFVMKQFHLNCQSKPSCDGLGTMRLDQLPLGLKKSLGLNKWQEADFFKEREGKLEVIEKWRRLKIKENAVVLKSEMSLNPGTTRGTSLFQLNSWLVFMFHIC